MGTRALEQARTWLGTPYHHQASMRGVGCDCLGLIRGVWRALYGTEPELPPAYTADWAEATGEETLLAAARRNLIEVALADAGPGDVVLFRMMEKGPAKHAGIMSGSGRFIHAYSNRAVTESSLSRWWQAKMVASFTWPEV
ncbi:C40 family peptidase [bacterium AH-315-P15]|nr:C40 family peptidase [bacterium AH-315-P15]